MDEFNAITLEVWADGVTRAALRFEHPDTGYSWSWYGKLRDLYEWLLDGGAISDLAYHADALMDSLALYRIEGQWSSNPRRTPEIRGYREIAFPHALRLELASALEYAAVLVMVGAWRGEGYERGIKVDITEAMRAGADYYGCGKGTVEIRYSTPEIEAAVTRWRKRCKDFGEQFERIVQIARNSTNSRRDHAVATFGYDHAGFFWSTPRLCGGLINHGTDDEPAWSTHT